MQAIAVTGKRNTLVENKLCQAEKKIDDSIDEIIDLIENDKSYNLIAEQFKVSQSTLCNVLNKDKYRARKQSALEIAADNRITKAEDYLLSIEETDNNSILKKKTSLSEFNIYLAKVKAKHKYDLNYKESIDATNNIMTPQLIFKVFDSQK